MRPKMEGYPVENLFLMQSAHRPFILMTTYLLLVLKIGPHLMSQRQKFDLFGVIRGYNILQIIINIYLFSMAVKLMPPLSIWLSLLDQPESETVLQLKKLYYLYLLLKVFDMVGTIFYVLGKKMEQVSFLHVFHHVGIMWISWFSCKYFPGIYGILTILLNTFDHTLMYGYYLQTSRGKMKNKLWKKSLTALQISDQIMIFLNYFMAMTNTRSSYEMYYVLFTLGYGFTVIYLYFRMYQNSYAKKKLANAGETTKNKDF